jgi:HAE1 family hydrophobic/amphiphilic exporter-1
VPGLVEISKSWALDTPELTLTLDPRRTAELGLTGEDVAHQVFLAMEGQVVTPLRQQDDRDLDIYLRYAKEDRDDPSALEELRISGPGGIAVPLRELAQAERRLGPRVLTREDLVQTQDLLGYQGGASLSDVVSGIQVRLDTLDLPANYEVEITGEQRDFQEARERMIRALLLGIIGVYLVLVAQFRSFRHPLTIMMAVPLQFIGVALALLFAGKAMSMPALLGIILLTGTVVNNSIVLIDYILQRRAEGVALEQAILDAVTVRYRPIMMTAFSDIAGMLPLALELAVGAERFSPIATVVIGGILAATLLTLVVIPVIFSLFERLRPSQMADPFSELRLEESV